MTVEPMPDGKHWRISCEGPKCAKTTIVKANPSTIGKALQQREWSWLRGDEMYDHVCSLKCLKALAAIQKD